METELTERDAARQSDEAGREKGVRERGEELKGCLEGVWTLAWGFSGCCCCCWHSCCQSRVVVLRKLNFRRPSPAPTPYLTLTLAPYSTPFSTCHLMLDILRPMPRQQLGHFGLQLCCIFQVIGHRSCSPQKWQFHREWKEEAGLPHSLHTFQVFWHFVAKVFIVFYVILTSRCRHISFEMQKILRDSSCHLLSYPEVVKAAGQRGREKEREHGAVSLTFKWLFPIT